MKKWVNIFIYVSLAFLLYALWKADYLKVPQIDNYLFLIISLILLYAGFITKSLVWSLGLKTTGLNVQLKDSIASIGVAELGKYIPGKLWAIMGRGMYISSFYPISAAKASMVSLNVQMLTIWSGLLLGFTGMFFINVSEQWIFLTMAGWLLLSLALFIRKIHDFIEKLTGRILKREVSIPLINVFKSRYLLILLFLDWLVRMTAFYFFIVSMAGFHFNYAASFGFPLAITLGILAIVVPGGIGVREGILAVWLRNAGLGMEMATSVAIVSRLWSLMGELAIFATGIFLKHKRS